MRRGGPPMLPVEPGGVPPFARVQRGPRGLRFAAIAAPAGAAGTDPGPLRALAAAPAAARQAVVVAEGKLVIACSPGVAFSVALPRVHVIHDRRPPGLDAVAGAAGANAALLHGADGWRGVVLPSLGDIAADLGPGPAAIRGDGRRVAALADGAIVELDVGAEAPAARHEGSADALCYAADGTLVAAAGSRVGPPGTAPGDGSPVVALAAAHASPRLAALHADGAVSVWEAGAPEPLATWPAPIAGAGSIAMSPGGDLVALGTPDAAEPVACLAEALTGAVARLMEGVRVIAPSTDPTELFVAGDWGCAWLTPPEETA